MSLSMYDVSVRMNMVRTIYILKIIKKHDLLTYGPKSRKLLYEYSFSCN